MFWVRVFSLLLSVQKTSSLLQHPLALTILYYTILYYTILYYTIYTLLFSLAWWCYCKGGMGGEAC